MALYQSVLKEGRLSVKRETSLSNVGINRSQPAELVEDAKILNPMDDKRVLLTEDDKRQHQATRAALKTVRQVPAWEIRGSEGM